VLWTGYHTYHYCTRSDKQRSYFARETSAYFSEDSAVAPEPNTPRPKGDLEACEPTTLAKAESSYKLDFRKVAVPILATLLTLGA